MWASMMLFTWRLPNRPLEPQVRYPTSLRRQFPSNYIIFMDSAGHLQSKSITVTTSTSTLQIEKSIHYDTQSFRVLFLSKVTFAWLHDTFAKPTKVSAFQGRQTPRFEILIDYMAESVFINVQILNLIMDKNPMLDRNRNHYKVTGTMIYRHWTYILSK